MDIHSDYLEPVTPALSYDNVSIWRAEDSGYHTSFTPGSMECSEISSENLDPSIVEQKICITGQIKVGRYNLTPEVKLRFGRKYIRSNTSHAGVLTENFLESPITYRGVKRPYRDDSPEINHASAPTPTSIIAGGIRKLKFSDSRISSNSFSVSSINSDCNTNSSCDFPSTPIKKICRTSCKLSPTSLRKPSKNLNFTIHSLSCEKQGLQPIIRDPVLPSSIVKQFRPDEKIDIMKMLFKKTCAMPAIMKIFSYLSNEDIYNFSLVSSLWLEVWEQVSKVKAMKLDYKNYLKNAKENQENKNKTIASKNSHSSQNRSLREVHNILNVNSQPVNSSVGSPPGTPRTMRFKRFTKSASLDSRIQLSCVRCSQPAKVTEEVSGEEWAECINSVCAYQFCRFCSCIRHPGKVCFQFDLDGPSPSKRKKTVCAVGTKHSRRNLRRLL